jgi:hypothetical protein
MFHSPPLSHVSKPFLPSSLLQFTLPTLFLKVCDLQGKVASASASTFYNHMADYRPSRRNDRKWMHLFTFPSPTPPRNKQAIKRALRCVRKLLRCSLLRLCTTRACGRTPYCGWPSALRILCPCGPPSTSVISLLPLPHSSSLHLSSVCVCARCHCNQHTPTPTPTPPPVKPCQVCRLLPCKLIFVRTRPTWILQTRLETD